MEKEHRGKDAGRTREEKEKEQARGEGARVVPRRGGEPGDEPLRPVTAFDDATLRHGEEEMSRETQKSREGETQRTGREERENA